MIGHGTGVRRTVRRSALLGAALAAVLLPWWPGSAGAGPATRAVPVTAAERAAAFAEPAIVSIDVVWEGYVRDRSTGELFDNETVRVSTRCTGTGVSSDGYLATPATCIDLATAAEDFYQRIAQRRVAAGTTPADQVSTLLTQLRSSAVIVGAPVTEPPKRTLLVRRAVTVDEPLPATVISTANPTVGDAALLKIEKSTQPMVELAGEGDAAAGTAVVTVECPAGTGDVVRPESRTGTIAKASPTVLMNAPPSASPTGGVVLNHDATIVGLVSHREGGQDVITPAPVVTGLLRAAQVDTKPAQLDQDYRDGLEAYWDGRYTASIERFDAVLAVIPSHLQAHDYRDKAQELRDAQGGGGRPDNSVIDNVRGWMDGRSGLLVGLGVLAAIGVFLIRRKAYPKDPEPGTPDGGTPAAAASVTPARIRPQTPQYCTNCSRALPTDATECPNCGSPRGGSPRGGNPGGGAQSAGLADDRE